MTIARGGRVAGFVAQRFLPSVGCTAGRGSAPAFGAAVAESPRIVSGIFYGYPADLVAEICGVSVETVARWKSGEVTPSRPALRLFDLHRRRKVLASPCWEGWLVNGDALVDPDGNETTQTQLRAYYFLCQLAAELAHDSPEALERLAQIQRAAAG